MKTRVTGPSNATRLIEMCEQRKKGESIHSGQFMVSHIENNEEEEAEDAEREQIIGLLADAASGGQVDESGQGTSINCHIASPVTCTDLQIYNPLLACQRAGNDLSQIIDHDLSTVFNTLNVTYT